MPSDPAWFDRLADRFLSNICSSWKGWLRVQAVWRDLHSYLPSLRKGRYTIFDVGAGNAPIASKLARYQNRLWLCEPSATMRERLETRLAGLKNRSDVSLFSSPFLALQGIPFSSVDLLLLHAVLEWQPDPLLWLSKATKYVRHNGWISVLFFQKAALRWRHLLLGHRRYVAAGMPPRRRNTLQPTYPLEIEEVQSMLAQSGLEVRCITPIRSVVDYMDSAVRAQLSSRELLKLERMHETAPCSYQTARYVHMLAQVNATKRPSDETQ